MSEMSYSDYLEQRYSYYLEQQAEDWLEQRNLDIEEYYENQPDSPPDE